MQQLAYQWKLSHVCAATMAWLLSGCEPPGPTSVNALDDAQAVSAHELVGAWFGELGGQEAYVHVVGTREGALETVLIGHNSQPSQDWGAALAAPARIGSAQFLSVKMTGRHGRDVSGTRDAQEYLIVRYRPTKDRRHVALFAMDPAIVRDAIKVQKLQGDPSGKHIYSSTEELQQFVETSSIEELFSLPIGYLERTSEEDSPIVEGNHSNRLPSK